MIVFLMYNVLDNEIEHEGSVVKNSHSQADTAEIEVAVTGKTHLFLLSRQ